MAVYKKKADYSFGSVKKLESSSSGVLLDFENALKLSLCLQDYLLTMNRVKGAKKPNLWIVNRENGYISLFQSLGKHNPVEK